MLSEPGQKDCGDRDLLVKAFSQIRSIAQPQGPEPLVLLYRVTPGAKKLIGGPHPLIRINQPAEGSTAHVYYEVWIEKPLTPADATIAAVAIAKDHYHIMLTAEADRKLHEAVFVMLSATVDARRLSCQ